MEEGGFGILIYLLLAIGGGILSAVKSSKEKKARQARQVILDKQTTDNSSGSEMTVQEYLEKMLELENQENFEEIEEHEQYDEPEMENSFQNEKSHFYSRGANSAKNNKILPEEDAEKQVTIKYEFDIRDAIIANEILNRKHF